MSGLVAAVALAVQIACTPSEISQSEARALAIRAAAVHTPQRFILDAEDADFGPKDAWNFRVFTINKDPGTSSDLAGWFSVNKHTASLSDPMLDDRRIVVLTLKREQARLRRLHCVT
jgi:ABC-type ATPase involved in cell division